MARRKKKLPTKKDYLRYAPLALIIPILLLTVGYSTLTTNLNMDAGAVVRIEADLRITSVTVASLNNNATATGTDYSVNSITSTIELPSSDSTATFDIVVTNIGNAEMGLFNVTGLPANLKYTFTGYTLSGTLCDDINRSQCTLGSRTTLHFTVSYDTNGYDGITTTYTINPQFEFGQIQYVAKIGNQYYNKLADAIAAVPQNNTAVTIDLLRNTSEAMEIKARQVVNIDMHNFTITAVDGKPVFETYGSLTVSSGTITSSAAQGDINIYSGGRFEINSGSVINTGTKQAIWNNGGTVLIGGTTTLRNTNTGKPAVENKINGTMSITGGTIISERNVGVLNYGTLTIGVSGGGVTNSTPVIQGATYGVSSDTNFSFYDGIIKGKTEVFNDDNYVKNNVETGYGIYYERENIGGVSYKTGRLAIIAKVTFDPTDGTVDETERNVEVGSQIGSLPVPVLTDYIFDGWFDDPDNGTEYHATDVIRQDVILYAHWTYYDDVYIASINGTNYRTLQAAINACPTNNSERTITLLRNTRENVTIAAGKKIVLDIGSYKIYNDTNAAVIANAGNLQIISGTIETNSTNTAAINNTGTLSITGGTVRALGDRQALYNNGGTATISGTAYLSATTEVRATVHNLENGQLTITGGTIISSRQEAVSNTATLTIGVKDGSIDTSTPVLKGSTSGLTNTATAKFYDGILIGKDASHTGTFSDIENNSTVTSGTQTIDGITYHTAFLQ